MQRSTRLAEVQMIGNCNRITKLSQFHGSLQTHRAIGARIPRSTRITAYPEVISQKCGSVRVGDNSSGTRELTLSRTG